MTEAEITKLRLSMTASEWLEHQKRILAEARK